MFARRGVPFHVNLLELSAKASESSPSAGGGGEGRGDYMLLLVSRDRETDLCSTHKKERNKAGRKEVTVSFCF